MKNGKLLELYICIGRILDFSSSSSQAKISFATINLKLKKNCFIARKLTFLRFKPTLVWSSKVRPSEVQNFNGLLKFKILSFYLVIFDIANFNPCIFDLLRFNLIGFDLIRFDHHRFNPLRFNLLIFDLLRFDHLSLSHKM